MLDAKTVKNAKPRADEYKLGDGGGLWLVVRPSGFKGWRYRYEADGRERMISLGAYDDGNGVSLKRARDLRDEARAKMRQEVAKAGEPRLKSEPLETVARRYLEKKAARWSDEHRSVLRKRLEVDVYPALGGVMVRNLRGDQILAVLRKVEDRGSIIVAHRIRGLLQEVLGFAIGEGLASDNPAVGITAAMRDIPKGKHRPAAVTIEKAREVLRNAESIPAHPVMRLCMRYLALTAQRPSEATQMPWAEFLGIDDQWKAPLWRIPAARMKMKEDHAVPLARQAIEVLDAVRTYSADRPFVFPSVNGGRAGISGQGMRKLLYRAGLTGVHVPHGWRASFSTIMNEAYPNDRLVIDLMIAHKGRGETEAAYNRAVHKERRCELAQIWADMLLEGAASAADLLKLPLARELVA